MKLYSYWRSTTSYRVRAALNLKGLTYETVPVDLVTGAQRSPEFTSLNPGRGVPALVLDDGTVLTQSLAIIDYLDAIAAPRLLPDDPIQRARTMAAAHAIAMDIHPVNNLRVAQHLQKTHSATPDETKAWMLHWMAEGFGAVETMVSPDTTFAFGDSPDLADICIVAQVVNAHRWGLDMTPYPKLVRIEAACLALPPIDAARPENQPDAPSSTKAPA